MKRRNRNLWILAGAAAFAMVASGIYMSAGAQRRSSARSQPQTRNNKSMSDASKTAKATFGNGCFWCTEAVFERLEGVKSVVSGYSGGSVPNPTYKQVCTGRTGHAEVVQIEYDPDVIEFKELLEVFWKTHDPTTPNRQGNDIGPQYRSVIFYHDEEQRQLAEFYKKKLNTQRAFRAPVITEISPLTIFFPAEKYHQEYFAINPRQPYCQMIIRPKVEKFEKAFKEKLKDK